MENRKKSQVTVCPIVKIVTIHISASQVAQVVRILLPMQEMQETQVQSLCWKDPMEKEMATHSSSLVRGSTLIETAHPGQAP